MKTISRLELVVRSRKVLARVDSYDVYLRGIDGLQSVSRRTINVFDYVLDEQQSRALEEAKDLAARSGLPLEVVDITRQSPLLRLLGLASGALGKRTWQTLSSMRRLKAAKADRQEAGEPSSAACLT